jgi:cell volume regulation protein A
VFPVDRLILIAGLGLVAAVAASRLSTRVGVPALVVFLLVGMLAGSEGLGRIPFEDYRLAHGVGTVALAFILFDGGLRTDAAMFRAVQAPALTLATVGVLLTTLVTAAGTVLVLDLPWLEALLLGSIVGSTDAAAVFAVLRGKGVRVRSRVAATLEVESGSNDPMAVLLTVVCIEVILGRVAGAPAIVWLFVRQAVLGVVVGYAVGRGAAWLIRRIRLDAAGLYPVLMSAAALCAYGAAAAVGGSGFLSVYIAGIVAGSGRLPFQRGILLFHDGLAWLSQMTMFLLLGLLSFPSRLMAAAGSGMLIAAALTLVARPAVVAACLAPFRFTIREIAFISWGGLKGAVPIILAMYPLLSGVADAERLFDVVFFVVLLSAVTQGWTLPAVAAALGLQRPPRPEPAVTLEITALQDVDGDIVDYTISPDSRAAGRRIRDLALPDGVLVAMMVRGDRVIPPRGSSEILAGDHVFVLLHPAARRQVDYVLGPAAVGPPPPEEEGEFVLRGQTRLAELEEFYGLRLEGPGIETLDEYLRASRPDPEVGDQVAVGPITLTVREVVGGRVETVGLHVQATDPEAERAQRPAESRPAPTPPATPPARDRL